jgi:hypothetical protein
MEFLNMCREVFHVAKKKWEDYKEKNQRNIPGGGEELQASNE